MTRPEASKVGEKCWRKIIFKPISQSYKTQLCKMISKNKIIDVRICGILKSKPELMGWGTMLITHGVDGALMPP